MPEWLCMGFVKRKYMLQLYGGEFLKQSSEPVTVFDQDLTNLANFMVRAMHHLNGIGLAAVQIGVHKRLIVLDIDQRTMSNPPTPGELQLLPQMPVALVNPQIVEFNTEITPYDEGCLSVPEVYAEVMRPSVIKVRAQDLSGNEFEFECGGLLARCIQHEVDHLDGKVFVDRVSDEVKAQVKDELAALLRRSKRNNFRRDIGL